MAVVGSIIKQPAEKLPVTVSFADVLAVGETVNLCAVTSKNLLSGADTTGTICNGSPSISSPSVSQPVQAGAHGEDHRLQYRATTSFGNIREKEWDIFVRET